NRVSLFALIFSIGILVDDAIVVVENIHRWHTLEPDTPLWKLIPKAVDEVGGPTILATFTVIAALLPMAFVSGLMGPYMSPIPINASMGMFISLVVAFVVTPWLAQKMLKNVDAHQHGGEDRMTKRLDGLFRRLMTPLLDARRGARNRLLLWLAVLALIGASVALPVVQLVVMKMLPFDNKSEFQVVLDMPVGTPVEDTARVLNEIGAHLAAVPEVTDWQSYAGTAAPINFNGLVRQYYLRSAPEQGDIQVNLVDKSARSRQSHEIAVAVRDAVSTIATRNGGNAKVVEVPPGPPVLSPIVAEIYGPDYAGQLEVARRVRAAFEATPDIVGVDDTVDEDAPKLVLRVDQAKAARMGVAQADIVEVVRLGLAGENVTPVHGGDNKYEIPVRVQLPAVEQSELASLLAMQVRARQGDNAGQLVKVSELVQVAETRREQILYRKDLLPVVYVTGDMGGKLDSPLYGMFDIRTRVNGMALAGAPGLYGTLGEWFISQPDDPYAGYQLKWDGEWQITYETFRDMGAAYAVGLVLIYLLVVAQFRSYLVPLIIMAPIPLTIIGVMPGHALFGAQFTATSMIGMIALAGIIVRNSILLVDFVNQQVAAGMELGEAVIRAAAVRAKPIGLTALAAMIGAVFILDDPIFNGLAISLIFGILVSTVLTLVVIPVLYYAAMRSRIGRLQDLPSQA
ncbi:MAG TPA: multidrug transporter AcrB, partial [Thauera sp.]|nr:multidrug transporter AcrB [Thauera sp.]